MRRIPTVILIIIGSILIILALALNIYSIHLNNDANSNPVVSPILALDSKIHIGKWEWEPNPKFLGDLYIVHTPVNQKVCLDSPVSYGELGYTITDTVDLNELLPVFPNPGCITPPKGRGLTIEYRIYYTKH